MKSAFSWLIYDDGLLNLSSRLEVILLDQGIHDLLLIDFRVQGIGSEIKNSQAETVNSSF